MYFQNMYKIWLNYIHRQRRAMRNITNSAIEQSALKPIQVRTEMRKHFPVEVDHMMLKDRSICRTICWKRRKLMPPEPKALSDIQIIDRKIHSYELSHAWIVSGWIVTNFCGWIVTRMNCLYPVIIYFISWGMFLFYGNRGYGRKLNFFLCPDSH